MNIDRLVHIVDRFEEVCVMVIGDLMLDRFIQGNVSRISPEAPVPVVSVVSDTFRPGGASNVASNIAALGGKVIALGVVGNDVNGGILKELLEERGVDTRWLVKDCHRPTMVKMRIIADHQQVVRADWENTKECDEHTQQLIDIISEQIGDASAILVSDYDKGVVTSRLLASIIPVARQRSKPIIIDPKLAHFGDYKAATVITPNLKEASVAAGIEGVNEESITNMGQKILAKLGCQAVIITRGKDGMSLLERNGNITHIPAITAEVYDVTGAGDTVAAVVALAVAAGAKIVDAARLANVTAGIVVRKLGTATATKEELERELNRLAEVELV